LRRLLKIAAALTVGASCFVNAQQLDLLIHAGTIVDGSGSPSRKADIGITGDRIVFVGAGGSKHAKREIDATGLIVTPGFIDPHTHTAGDLSDPKRSRNDAYLMQGVTTVATGNDGDSPREIGATLAKSAARS
jgi:N-acyl-D-amino-acid deacylase